jgi:biopolymer transport protein ExbD
MKVPVPTVSASDEEFQMTPMIDMVFLLLIFFMVASNINQADRKAIRVPIAKSSVVPKELEVRRNVTILPVQNDEEAIYIALTPVTIEQLKATIEKDLLEKPDMSVFVRADKNVKHKKVREVMKACAEAGAVNIIFATLQTEVGQ